MGDSNTKPMDVVLKSCPSRILSIEHKEEISLMELSPRLQLQNLMRITAT